MTTWAHGQDWSALAERGHHYMPRTWEYFAIKEQLRGRISHRPYNVELIMHLSGAEVTLGTSDPGHQQKIG